MRENCTKENSCNDLSNIIFAQETKNLKFKTKRCSIRLKDEEAEIEVTRSRLKENARATNPFWALGQAF